MGLLLFLATMLTAPGRSQEVAAVTGADAQQRTPAQVRAGTVKIVVLAPAAKAGAGIVVRRDAEEAYIVTAAHVVSDANEVFVEFYRAGGRWTAEVRNVEFDNVAKGFALLRVTGKLPKEVNALPLASNVAVTGGEAVTMVGHQTSIGDWGLLNGSVSGRKNREIVIQAQIREQTSGGPVVYLDRVVGLLQRRDPEGGFGYASTAQAIREYVEGLIKLDAEPVRDIRADAVAAMQWIQSRCGPGILLVVPAAVGSSIDRAARTFAVALGNSGVRPVPVVFNVVAGFFSVNGSFSVQKFDDWQRSRGTKEGCLLAIVPEEVREHFGRPRFDAALGGKSYGVVLPRGVMSETASKWNTVFVKASDDPDFAREIGGTGLRVDVVPIR